MSEKLDNFKNTVKTKKNHLVVATALFAALMGGTSCSDKNDGMPVRLQNMDLSDKNHEVGEERISIKNNEISCMYTVDDLIYNKVVDYKIKVKKTDEGKFVVKLTGTGYNSDIEKHSLNKTFNYDSIEDFAKKFSSESSAYLEDIMGTLLDEDQDIYTEYEEARRRIVDHFNEFSSTVRMLSGWLKYSVEKQNTVQENPVQKEGSLVKLPLTWGTKKYDISLEKTKDVMGERTSSNKKYYTISINGKSENIELSKNALQFGEDLFAALPKEMTKHMNSQDKTERVMPKLLEVYSLLND